MSIIATTDKYCKLYYIHTAKNMNKLWLDATIYMNLTKVLSKTSYQTMVFEDALLGGKSLR